MAKNQDLAKLVRTARLIARPGGASVYEIMGECGIKSRSSVYRIVEKLEELGLPVYSEVQSRRVVFHSLNSESSWLVPVARDYLSTMDADLLFFLLSSLPAHDPLGSKAAEVKAKLEVIAREGGISLENHDISFIDVPPLPRKPREEDDRNIAAILDAIRNKKTVRIDYLSCHDQEGGIIEVLPVLLYRRDGGYFAYGCASGGKAVSLALERVGSITPTEDEIPLPEDFPGKESFLSDPFGHDPDPDGDEQTILLRLSPELGIFESAFSWPENVKIELQQDGRYHMEIRTRGTRTVVRWILERGAEVKVLSPESLRAQIEETARRVVSGDCG